MSTKEIGIVALIAFGAIVLNAVIGRAMADGISPADKLARAVVPPPAPVTA